MAGQASNPVPAMTVHHPLEKPVVVIGPQFLTQYPVDLTIASKHLTVGENDFRVTDVNGTLIFSVKSKFMSIHDRQHLKDAAGNILVTLKQKIMTMHRRWQVFRGESTDEKDLLFSVKKSSMEQSTTQLDVFLASNTTSESVPDFKLKGSWELRSCTLYLGDGESNIIVAQISERHLLDRDHFAVTVYPTIDYAFIVALVVVLDEIRADRAVQAQISGEIGSAAADTNSGRIKSSDRQLELDSVTLQGIKSALPTPATYLHMQRIQATKVVAELDVLISTSPAT